MTTNVYEGMFLLDSNRYAKDAAGVSGGIVEMIEKHGGEILASRLWAEQKLAYPIGNHKKGTYWLTYFRIDSESLTELDRTTHLNDNVIRSLILKIDARLVDAMVQHATGGGETTSEGAEDNAEAAAETSA